MSLNFKILRRSFSLRNNVSEDRQNENVPNFHKEFPLTNEMTSDGSINNYQLTNNSIDDIPHKHQDDTLNKNMELILPFTYTRQTARTSIGMQLFNTKKHDNRIPSNSVNILNTSNTVNDVLLDKKYQKQALNQQGKHLKGLLDVEFSSTKMSKKQLKLAREQLKKLTKINIHQHALFSAVENNQLDKAKSILESTDVDVNSLNNDALSPLDVAVLNNNRSLTKILLEHGAHHGSQFKNSDSLGKHLNTLLYDTANRIHELSGGTKYNSTENDARKQIDCLQRRCNALRHIMLGWIQTSTPYPPYCIFVDVTSTNSVTVYIQESSDGAITTKFKLQWSSSTDFGNIIGEQEIHDLNSFQGVMCSTFILNNLCQGKRYFFRASSGNVKGWSNYRLSSPKSVVPSSWRDVENCKKFDRKQALEDLLSKVRSYRAQQTATETQLDAPLQTEMYAKKKATIKQLFSATSKFQKNLKRGIYLSCILYHEGKVLVTNDDFLPTIEIDENYPNNCHIDYHWLMKVATNWDIVKSLKNDMERHSTPVIQFRIKLLSAVCQMQSVMGLKDLGCFYYQPFKDTKGTIVLSCVSNVKNPKRISVLNSRWIPLRKIQRKLIPVNDDSNMNEIVLASIQNQIDYHQSLSIKLPKGLYIGYLKMQCSMDQMHIVVPKKTPNVLPHCKIRDNPHICAEEWDVIRRTDAQNKPSEIQKRFLDSLTNAAMRIFNYMGTPSEHIPKHKLYNLKVIEFNNEVNFLIICPPIELSCAAPGQREMLLQRGDLISIPNQIFEKIQVCAYYSGIIQPPCRLYIILELDSAIAHHSLREAFSCIEMKAAKEHLSKVEEFLSQLNDFWKGARWLLDVMTFARNRCPYVGVTMQQILGMAAQNSQSSINDTFASIDSKHDLLLPPPSCNNVLTKKSPCRVSWPNSYQSGLLATGHSKSDQQLNFVTSGMRSKYFNQTIDIDCSRRNSAESIYRHCFNNFDEAIDFNVKQLPLSKSDDTLTASKPSLSPSLQRKRSKTINACTSSPNCFDSDRAGNTKSSEQNRKSTPSTKTNFTNDSKENTYSSMACTIENNHRNEHNSRFFKYETEGVEKSHLNKDKCLIGKINKLRGNDTDRSCQFGIIQVYAAYETGLGKGIHLKLRIKTATTAREIIDLVVKQLNMIVLLNGKNEPIYSSAKLKEFCLVAVIGAAERCLSDDFRPLQLQNPWKKGRLYVRKTHDFYAAIDSDREEQQI